MGFLLILSSLVIAYSSWIITKLVRNYITARKIGFPIVVTPFTIVGLIWPLFESRLRPILNKVPFGLFDFVNYGGLTWMWTARYTLHKRLGPVFVVVTPNELMMIIADANAAESMLNRRKDFIKPRTLYEPLEIFGRNVDTLNGEDWQRHRRITTPPFNERNNNHVWKESLRQATGMLKQWTSAQTVVQSTSKDTLTLALHVLTSAGMGKSYEFDGGLTAIPQGHTMSYKDSLQKILSNLYSAIIIMMTGIPAAVLPRSMIEIMTAISEFREYMIEMVTEEKASIQQDEEKDNLLSVLVRISEKEDPQGRNRLTAEEIMGNLFIYNLAGHDTTANSLSFMVTLMASDNHWQNWVREELETVFISTESTDWNYENFSKLTRCMAVMCETLRLYGPIFMIPKAVSETPTTLTIRKREHNLPANCYTLISLSALHSSPEYWGEDALVWRPDRWIKNNAGVEELVQPHLGSFLPWASGPRVCPGMKFAKVEFMAVMVTLFRSHQVKPLLEQGEGSAEAKKRLLEVVEDSKIVINLQMKNPERVKLVWESV